MKLIDILARDLKFWPEGFDHALLTQSVSGQVEYVVNNRLRWAADQLFPVAEDWKSAIVSKEDWSKTAALKWNGEDPPPVGTFCEVCFPRDTKPEWGRTIVKYSSAHALVLAFPDDGTEIPYDVETLFGTKSQPKFRPIRTAEQVEAEERDTAVREFCKATGANLAIGFAAYDAGYRKQEQAK
jgi:hypothetical protein